MGNAIICKAPDFDTNIVIEYNIGESSNDKRILMNTFNMEIIKHGRTYEVPQVKVCPVCECEFSYVKKDIKENWVRVTSKDSDLTFTYIHCPECGKTIIIKDYRK